MHPLAPGGSLTQFLPESPTGMGAGGVPTTTPTLMTKCILAPQPDGLPSATLKRLIETCLPKHWDPELWLPGLHPLGRADARRRQGGACDKAPQHTWRQTSPSQPFPLASWTQPFRRPKHPASPLVPNPAPAPWTGVRRRKEGETEKGG